MLPKINVGRIELDDALDVAGFVHRACSVGELLRASTVGAGVYEAEAGRPIWPYHYHHGVEEWLYVISGAPVLRDPGGERTLAPGDFVCFPSGPSGAHTVSGPGRFMIVSTRASMAAPYMSVYPDSGKVSGPEGILLRSSAVSYWYGEGDGSAAEPVTGAPPPEPPAQQPIVNAASLELAPLPGDGIPPGFRSRRARLGVPLGAELIGASVYELDPGEGTAPYHYEIGREEWMLVLAGEPTLRQPDGEQVLSSGDMVFFPAGADGAHRVRNRGAAPARLIIFSTAKLPISVHYPDSDKVLILEPGGNRHMFRRADEVDYYHGEG